MITAIKKGGIFTLILATLVVVVANFIPFYESWYLVPEDTIFQKIWIDRLVFVVLILIQSIWFQRIIHNARFFEQWSIWPWVVFMVVIALTPDQFSSFETLVPNFVWLIFYQKLFYYKDRELSNYQIFMEAGILFCIGFLFYPKFILMLPFLLILLNQFAVNDLNRFYLVVVSFLMVGISALVIAYLFISESWVMGLTDAFSFQIDLNHLQSPHLLYTYLCLLFIILGLAPLVYNRLGFMQTQNRTVINILYIQIVFTVIVSLISGQQAERGLILAALPIAFILSFGTYHLKTRWLTNIILLCVIFALVLVQWTYMRDVFTL